jgi:hypothetical protein
MFQMGYLDCTWTQEQKMYNLNNNKIEKQQNHKAPLPKHTTMSKNDVIKQIWTTWKN